MSVYDCALIDIEGWSESFIMAEISSQRFGYQIIKHNIPNVWLETQGEGVKVAILDTGCQVDHEDLIGSVTYSHGNVADVHGHGSHVSGIISANNNTKGIVGVAPLAELHIYKVLDDNGSGTWQGVADGINAAMFNGADIISMSLGGSGTASVITSAIVNAYNTGVVVICAAGNSGNTGQIDYPGRYSETISVGALDENNIRASFSSTGSNLDFMAPGVSILSTVPGDGYQYMSGSSMSCPWLAGIVALMISKHRQFGGFTPIDNVEDVREHLRRHAIDMQSVGKDLDSGWGYVDVQSLFGGLPSPSPSSGPSPGPFPSSGPFPSPSPSPPVSSPFPSPSPIDSSSSISSSVSSSSKSSVSSHSSKSSVSSRSSKSSVSSGSSKSSVSSKSSASSKSSVSSKSSISSSSVSSSSSSSSSVSSSSSSSSSSSKSSVSSKSSSSSAMSCEFTATLDGLDASIDLSTVELNCGVKATNILNITGNVVTFEFVLVVVSDIHPNAAGRDIDNLEDEWMEFMATCSSIDLTGWTVQNQNAVTYTFPDNFVLVKDAKVKLRSGHGVNTATDLYWGRNHSLWNNRTGNVKIFDNQGILVFDYRY